MKALLSIFLLVAVLALGYFTFVYQSEPPSLLVEVLDDTTGEKNADAALFTVRLNHSPGFFSEVRVALKSSDEVQGVLEQKEIKFSSDNWEIPQEIKVIGQDEQIDDGDVKYQIIVQAFDEKQTLIDTQSVSLIGMNDDVRDFLIGLVPSEKKEPWITLRIKPNSEPSQAVRVQMKAGTSDNKYEGLPGVPKGSFKARFDKTVLEFDSKNWKEWQIVRVASSTGSLDESSPEQIQKNFDDLGMNPRTGQPTAKQIQIKNVLNDSGVSQKIGTPAGLLYVFAVVSGRENVREYRGSSKFVMVGRKQCKNCNVPVDAK